MTTASPLARLEDLSSLTLGWLSGQSRPVSPLAVEAAAQLAARLGVSDLIIDPDGAGGLIVAAPGRERLVLISAVAHLAHDASDPAVFEEEPLVSLDEALALLS